MRFETSSVRPPNTAPRSLDLDTSRPLPPMGAEKRGPFGFVERTDGQPPVDGDGVRLFQEGFERIDRHREAEVLADDRFHRHESQDVALTVEHGAAAISLFDRHGQLDQGLAVNLADAGDDAADHAVLQSSRIADGDDVLPLLDRVGVPQFQRLLDPRPPRRITARSIAWSVA